MFREDFHGSQLHKMAAPTKVASTVDVAVQTSQLEDTINSHSQSD